MADELPTRRLICFVEKNFVAIGKYPIDKFPTIVYNTLITLSRATEVTGPVKSQQPEHYESKVLIPAVLSGR